MDNREMAMIDLTPFYDKNEFRSNIAAPSIRCTLGFHKFRYAWWCYLCKRHIIMRVVRKKARNRK